MKQMKLLTTRDAADRLGMTDRTIARWCRSGYMPAMKLGRVWRIRMEDLIKFCEEGK